MGATPHTSDPEFLVLHAVALKGFASPEAVAELTGWTAADTSDRLGRAGAKGHATYRDGRISGWTLTADGKAEHAGRLEDERDAIGPHGLDAMHAAYEPAFSEVNQRLKQVCTDWQVRIGPGGEQAVNDHADAAYDRAVIAALRAVHDDVAPLCTGLAAVVARLGGYEPRLAEAVSAVEAGQHDRFTRPLNRSYHDVWMELHHDLLITLGLERTSADA